MTVQRPIVLIVDDELRSFHGLPRLVSADGVSTRWVPDAEHGLQVLSEQKDLVRVIIVDVKSSGLGGGGFLHLARQIVPEAAILVTGPVCSFLYHQGDFYEFSGPSLKHSINQVINSLLHGQVLADKNFTRPAGRSKTRERFGAVIGRSRSMNEIYRLIINLQDTTATVLLQGESGTGKEILAQTIHQTGPAKNQPFIAVNCGAIPANLIESELFGHERGAFTSAINQRRGKFELAQSGTIFLDEISELDLELQVKLLRVLQEREFQRVGGNTTLKARARVIAATSRDLRQAVKAGQFREDLFYRLNVVPIKIPPLRERREDIPLLLDHFLRQAAREFERPAPSLSREAKTALVNYAYPGNVRELANIVERLLVLTHGDRIAREELPEEVRGKRDPDRGGAELLKELPEEGVPLQDLEKELIIKTLEKSSGNKMAAARMLGITRRRLYLRLNQYGLS